MANVLGLLLQLSLAMAFTQCLWRLVRFSSFKTVTLDRFFTMRSNLASLFGVILQREAWILVLISILIWAIPIAVSFPPGAITVVPEIHPSLVSNGKVPTFAASDVSPISIKRLIAQPMDMPTPVIIHKSPLIQDLLL
jgi:beta-lactamase regulating signal transducer with metallopeptidase domain